MAIAGSFQKVETVLMSLQNLNVEMYIFEYDTRKVYKVSLNESDVLEMVP